MPVHQLPMFGCTLICQAVRRSELHVHFEFRVASTDRVWTITLSDDDPIIDHLSRPGACFALVELASVGQVASRGRF
jgi:hypothetical protein